MLPRKSKGSFVHRNGPCHQWSAGTTSSATVAAMALPEPSTLPPPLQPLTALNLSQLTAATNDIISKSAAPSHLPSASGLPASSSPVMEILPMSSPAPSTFLTTQTTSNTASSAVLTSVSRQEKCKVSALGSDYDGAASKRSRPLSASVQAQQDGNKAIMQLSDVMEEMRQTFARSSARASTEDFGRAVSMITQCTTLSDDERIDIIDFLGQDDKHVVKYLNMDDSLRSVWVQRRLADIHRAALLGGSLA